MKSLISLYPEWLLEKRLTSSRLWRQKPKCFSKKWIKVTLYHSTLGCLIRALQWNWSEATDVEIPRERLAFSLAAFLRRHDIQHNDTQHNDTKHNDTHQNDTKRRELICDIRQNVTQREELIFDIQQNDTEHNNTLQLCWVLWWVSHFIYYAECH